MQVEDHQRGCCDDDTANVVSLPLLCSLCAGDDQEEDRRLESTEIKTKIKTIFVLRRRSRQRSRRRSNSSGRGTAKQQRDDSTAVAFAATHTRDFLFLVCFFFFFFFFFFLLSPRHKHTRNVLSSLFACLLVACCYCPSFFRLLFPCC